MAYAPTKRDLAQKIKNEGRQIANYAAAYYGGKTTLSNFTTWSTPIAAQITADLTAIATAPA